MSTVLLAAILLVGLSLPHTAAFRSIPQPSHVTSSSSRRMLYTIPTEIGDGLLNQFLSTTITTATEVVNNDIIAKQVFEPQMSTETGAGKWLASTFTKLSATLEETTSAAHLPSYSNSELFTDFQNHSSQRLITSYFWLLCWSFEIELSLNTFSLMTFN